MKASQQTIRTIDTPHYGYWRSILLSLFSPRLYIDVAKRWRGFSIGYLFLLVSIACIPLTIRAVINLNNYLNDDIFQIVENLPRLYIQNEEIKITEPMPYLIKNKAGKVVTIIDTTGKINSFTSEYPDAEMLFTKKALIYRIASPSNFFTQQSTAEYGQIYTQDFEGQADQVFDGKEWLQTTPVKILRVFIDVVLYPLIIAILFPLYFIALLSLTPLIQVFSGVFFKLTLHYLPMFRVLMVSSTLFAFVFFTLMFSAITFVGSGMLLLGLLIAYVCFALRSIKKDSSTLVRL